MIEKQLLSATVPRVAQAGSTPATAVSAAGAPSAGRAPEAAADARAYGVSRPVAATAAGEGASGEATRGPVEGARAFVSRVVALAQGPAASVGLSPVFVAAQAALESGWGRHEIRHPDGTSARNLFSLKAGPGWTGKSVEVATTEYVDGSPVRRVERFRAYDTYAEGLADYVKVLTGSGRYREAVANGQDAGAFARAIARAGYATDPQYARKLARVIEQARSLAPGA
jgi:flagellar protein FlgJ